MTRKKEIQALEDSWRETNDIRRLSCGCLSHCFFCVVQAINVFRICICCGCCRRRDSREKAKRRNVLFEVAEATMMNWTRQMSLTEAGSHNIYVEVFLEGAGTRATCARIFQKCCAMLCCIICCRKRGKKGKAQRGRTPSVSEGREMRWRIYNDEFFLMALFSLGQQRLKLHEGDQVNVVAEVYRIESFEPPDSNGMRIAVMRGSFKAGTLGLVTLWLSEDNREDREKLKEDSGRPVYPHLNLELRPTSSRAFRLEEAQPRSKEETIESIHAELLTQKTTMRRMGVKRFSMTSGDRAMGRVSSNSQSRVETASTSSEMATGCRRSWNNALQEAAVGVPNMMTRVRTAIGARGSPNRKRMSSALQNASTGSTDDLGELEHTAETQKGRRFSQWSDESSNHDARSQLAQANTGSTGLVQGHASCSWLLQRQLTREAGALEDGVSVKKENSLRTSRAEKKAVGFRMPDLARGFSGSTKMCKKETDTSSRPSLGSRMTRERSEWGAGFRRLKRELLGGKAVSSEPRLYDSWIPKDWVTTWKNPWPVESDDLAGKHEVVPLMEAEFRRDCVVFFNTLFPRTQTTAFRIIREFALTLPARRKMSHHSLSHRSSKSLTTRKSVYSQVNAPARQVSGMRGSLRPTRARLVDDDDQDPDSPLPNQRARFFMTAEDSIASTSLSHQSSMTTVTDGDAHAFHQLRSSAGRRYYLGPDADEGFFEMRLTALMNDYVPRIFFLKRLYACFACCGVYINEAGNSAQIGELWPYPLASVLGHGSRILIRLEDVEASEFLNFLLTGDPYKSDWKEKGMPQPLKARAAATHAVQLQTETGHLMERKLKTTNVTDTFENIKDGRNRKHLGLNMPIGGAGNPSPMGPGHIVNFTGKVLKKEEEKKSSQFRASIAKVMPSLQRGRKHKYERKGSVTSTVTTASNGTAVSHASAWKTGSSVSKSPRKSSSVSNSPRRIFNSNGDLEASCTMQQTNTLSSEAPLSPNNFDRQHSATSASFQRPHVSSDPGQWQVKHEDVLWRQVPRVQGGHLYIRVDGFGLQVNRHCGADSALHFTTREQRDNQLHEQFRKGMQPLERAILRRTVESKFHKPGEIFFPESVPILPRDRHEHLMGHAQHASEKHAHGATGECHFPRLVRVSSEPSLHMHVGVDAPLEDVIWLNKMICQKASYASPVSVVPPSVAALRLLLHHYNPLGTHLFGTSHFKSVEDLFHEIRSLVCCISIDKTGTLQRLVEPVVCQLRFRGRILMQSHQRVEGEEVAVQKHRFITMQLSEDQNWKQGLQDVIWAKLGIGGSRDSCLDTVLNTLWKRDLEESHSIIEETMVSPSYPGLLCHYHTHLIQWDIAEDCDLEVFAKCGLPLDLENRQNNPYNYDFTHRVAPDDTRTHGKSKTLYWSWVPELEARKLQHWVNLGDATSDDRWARHVFQKEGAVQFPPSEDALTYLLQRCGIDIYRFGTGDRSLNAMWRELTNQESTLHMESGQPVLAIEDVLILVRWKQKDQENFDLLVQIREEHPDGRVNGNPKLLGGRKLKEESWSSAAMRCVMERLQVTKAQVVNILAHRPDDASEYTFVEERQKASTFPDIDTLHRTHLVTYTLKPDITKTYAGRKVLGILHKNYGSQGSLTPASLLRSPISGESRFLKSHDSWAITKCDSGASLLDQDASYGSDAEDHEDEIPAERSIEIQIGSEFGESMYEFKWLHDDEPGIQEEVVGMNLFEMAKKREERHRISSVLLGLEGADPGNVSAFGMGHDASGASSKVSACGGRKWRAYRTNHAMQIPADIGGIRMKVNKQMFAEVMSTCEILDLLDPGVDILWEQNVSYPRELLDHRHAEKEFFKQILGGNGLHASKTLAWMKAYRMKYKTPAQVHSGMKLGRPKLRRGRRLNRDRACRTLEESLEEAALMASPRSEHGFTEYIVDDNEDDKSTSFSETCSPGRYWSGDMPSLPLNNGDFARSHMSTTVYGKSLRDAAVVGPKASELLPCNPALHYFPETPRPGIVPRSKAGGSAC